MAYWIFENGDTIGPFRAVEVLEHASPRTLIKDGDGWVRLDQHRDFSMLDFDGSSMPPINPPLELTEKKNNTVYWIHENGQSIGPLNIQEVLRIAAPDSLVSFGQGWRSLREHPDFGHEPSSEPVSVRIDSDPETTKAAQPKPFADIAPKSQPQDIKKKSPRVRRLERDHDRVSERFKNWPLIKIEFAGGSPPDTYRVSYNVRGIYATQNGDLLERHEHVVEIKLGLQYPRRPPQCKLLTPLFHPNFNNTDVCAQDNYAASEGLDDLIVRIGRMIAYQEYNTKSPLNGIAGKWAEQNSTSLPVDKREISPPAPSDGTLVVGQTCEPRTAAAGR